MTAQHSLPNVLSCLPISILLVLLLLDGCYLLDMGSCQSYTSIYYLQHILSMLHIRIIRCIALCIILSSLYYLTIIYQLLHHHTTPALDYSYNNATTITNILIVGTSPSTLLSAGAIPLLTKLSPTYSHYLTTIYVWILGNNVDHDKSDFINNLHNYYKVSFDVVFINDYVQAQHPLTDDWLTKSHIYFDNLDLIVVHQPLHQLQTALLNLIHQSHKFIVQQMPSTGIVMAFRDPLKQLKSQQCSLVFEDIISHTGIVEISSSTGQSLNNLVFSPKIKIIQPLHITVSTTSLASWLRMQNITAIYVPQLHDQEEQQAIIQIILILAYRKMNIKFIVRSKQWHRKITTNLLFNNFHAQLDLLPADQSTIWALTNVVGLYSLTSFERELDGLRTRIISDKSKIIIMAKDEGYNLVNIRNEFSVISIQEKVQKADIKKEQNNMFRLHLIEKSAKRKQIKNTEKIQPKQYTFSGDALTPMWYKNLPIAYEVDHCFSQRNEQYSQYFIGEANKEKYASFLKQAFKNKIKNALWCWEGEYQLFYYLVKHAQYSISFCDSITQESLKKFKKIAILNDFNGRINQEQQKNYSMIFIEQGHKEKIRSTYSHQYKLIQKNKEACTGIIVNSYCIED